MLTSSLNRAVSSTRTATCLPALGRPDERPGDRALERRPVHRLLDGQHVGIDGGPIDEGLDGTERLVGVVQQDVAGAQHGEDVAGIGAEPSGRHGVARRIFQLRAVEGAELRQRAEVEELIDLVQVVGAELELPQQQLPDGGGHPGVDLEPHRPAEAPLAELHLDGGQQVVGLLVAAP